MMEAAQTYNRRRLGAIAGAISVVCLAVSLLSATPVSAATTTAPTISSFTPTKGKVGTVVTITGSGFAGATSVLFDQTPATFTVVSDTKITTKVPTGATSGFLHVKTPGGKALSTVKFKVVSVPAVTLSPTSGPVGTSVTIRGTGFTGATTVLFDQTPATFTVVSDTKITATVPTGATTGFVHVKAPAGKSESTVKFKVT